MELAVGLPVMLFLGLAMMALCYLFMKACEKI